MAKPVPQSGAHHDSSASPFFEQALGMSDFIIGWILVYAMAIALVNLALLMMQHLFGGRFRMFFAVTQPDASHVTLDRIKLESGRLIGFALLLLVAADVLETLMKPMHDMTMDELYKMALVSAIRTALAFFLGKEVEEIMHNVGHEEGHNHPSAPVEETIKNKTH